MYRIGLYASVKQLGNRLAVNISKPEMMETGLDMDIDWIADNCLNNKRSKHNLEIYNLDSYWIVIKLIETRSRIDGMINEKNPTSLTSIHSNSRRNEIG